VKRVRIRIEDVASRDNLAEAVFRAARGKRHRPEVRAFFGRLEENLRELHCSILDGSVRVGEGRRFRIRDPKPRTIVAPCFRERILHHALMNRVGPVLDRALVDDSYACRLGKGTLAAVARAQEHLGRFPWYAKMDVRAYFASVDHALLKQRLRRRFKGEETLDLLDRILAAHEDGPGKGLPIGALTSQCFANFYLDPLDRFLLEGRRVPGYIRYMDDFVFWTGAREETKRIAREVGDFLADHLALAVKEPYQINQSRRGVTVCGFRILPHSIRPAWRRRRRYLDVRRRSEAEYLSGRIDAEQLQRAHDAALAITAHGDARAWRRARAAAHPGHDWHDLV
jgi:RNA-directed DNA polymerase